MSIFHNNVELMSAKHGIASPEFAPSVRFIASTAGRVEKSHPKCLCLCAEHAPAAVQGIETTPAPPLAGSISNQQTYLCEALAVWPAVNMEEIPAN